MVDYKFYEDTDLDIADGEIELDLDTDLGGRQPALISCDDGELDIRLDFNGGFGEEIRWTSCDGVLNIEKVKKIGITAREDNSAYRVIAGLS